jgi:cysteine desulfurase
MLAATGLVFTGGGTEATNLAMRGFLRGRSGGRILFGAADHPSVVNTARDLEADGFEAVPYPVGEQCRPRLDEFVSLLDEDVRFVSLLHGNNEVGTLLPLEAMVARIRERAPRAHIHLDAVQAFAKIPIDIDRWGVDSATLAAHKIHGPKGVGALALGHRHQPRPLITGGGQEGGLRGGTENACGNMAFAMAARNWISRQREESGRIEALRNRVQTRLLESIPDIELLGDPGMRLPHILSVAVRGVRGEVVMHHLEEKGICASTGSACAASSRAKSKTGSHVLEAMGVPPDLQKGALRISFGRFTSDANADALLEELPPIIARLRELGL